MVESFALLATSRSEEDVKATFAKAGEVVECRLLKPDFSLEWAALVRLSTVEQAKVARET